MAIKESMVAETRDPIRTFRGFLAVALESLTGIVRDGDLLVSADSSSRTENVRIDGSNRHGKLNG